ncbi:hypothetical protein [Azospirillum thermophilum]|uniref:Uncharacterized protein n=1 Tax=Azospirillum thermophilum TaxID=2202148 RepID=A0A2S2CP24_9PROT|nr:hypothetical protein [Azospirillum thermophilum]AWK86273.1 hypothetical protein DEW08_08470 [Azospirillum thermophilum]
MTAFPPLPARLATGRLSAGRLAALVLLLAAVSGCTVHHRSSYAYGPPAVVYPQGYYGYYEAPRPGWGRPHRHHHHDGGWGRSRGGWGHGGWGHGGWDHHGRGY